MFSGFVHFGLHQSRCSNRYAPVGFSAVTALTCYLSPTQCKKVKILKVKIPATEFSLFKLLLYGDYSISKDSVLQSDNVHIQSHTKWNSNNRPIIWVTNTTIFCLTNGYSLNSIETAVFNVIKPTNSKCNNYWISHQPSKDELFLLSFVLKSGRRFYSV